MSSDHVAVCWIRRFKLAKANKSREVSKHSPDKFIFLPWSSPVRWGIQTRRLRPVSAFSKVSVSSWAPECGDDEHPTETGYDGWDQSSLSIRRKLRTVAGGGGGGGERGDGIAVSDAVAVMGAVRKATQYGWVLAMMQTESQTESNATPRHRNLIIFLSLTNLREQKHTNQK